MWMSPSKLILAVLAMAMLLGAAPSTQPNDAVLRIAKSFKDGGGYVKSGGSGCPAEVRFNGTVILKKGKDGTYCSGFTFTVAMAAATELKLLEGKSVDQIRTFQQQWYGSGSDADIRERQAPIAMQNLGIGGPISADEATAGDFCQFWRTSKTGHSVVFLKWIVKDGKRVGLRYRSSQELTRGISDRTEYFADTGIDKALIIRERMYFARLSASISAGGAEK